MKSILHICTLDKFIPDFINFSRKHLSHYEQLYITYNTYKKYPYDLKDDAKHIDNKLFRYLKINYELYKKDVVLIHGLFDPYLMLLLFIQPWLLKKCRWLVWGGDVYHLHKLYDGKRSFKKFIREYVIKHMGYIVTSIDGDYAAIKSMYKAQGKRINVFTYPASLYQLIKQNPRKDKRVNILVGNSADPSNHHIDVFQILRDQDLCNIRVIVPLSYGDINYKEMICKAGVDILGEAFEPLVDFIQYDEYLKILSNIDIAIFNHDRQQALSNTRVLLGMGKKVYMRPGLSSTIQLEKLGLVIHSLESFELNLNQVELSRNSEIIKKFYSEGNLKNNLIKVFEANK